LENWIAQKRAEIAKEKSVFENKENVPTASVTSVSLPPPPPPGVTGNRQQREDGKSSRGNLAPPISGRPRVEVNREPLLFTLGDDYRLSKVFSIFEN